MGQWIEYFNILVISNFGALLKVFVKDSAGFGISLFTLLFFEAHF